ncbi:MAG TPA: HAD-IIIC family phosphatase [Myxococcales bacterium]|jgi:FkbH-like protein
MTIASLTPVHENSTVRTAVQGAPDRRFAAIVDGVEPRYRLSKFVQVYRHRGVHVLAHGPGLRRLILADDIAQALEPLRERPLTASEYRCCFDEPEVAATLFELLLSRGFAVEDGADEDAMLDAELQAAGPGGAAIAETRRLSLDTPAPLSAALLRGSGLQPLRIALVGGCVLEVLPEHLRQAGLRQGFLVNASCTSPERRERIVEAAAEGAEISVLHPFFRSLLAPLWDFFHALDDDTIVERLALIEARLHGILEAFAEGLSGRLGVVHNLSAPQVSPRGRFDFAMGEAVARLNRVVADACRRHRNLFFLNEEAIAANCGKALVQDDLHKVFSHHAHGLIAPREPPPWSDAPRTRAYLRALCNEYFAAWAAWTGKGAIKCVVCDLDGTLWPHPESTDGLSWLDDNVPLDSTFEGIHQALLVLKARGILLATCSKNDEAQVLGAWRKASDASGGTVLRPRDFVLHRIDWRRKPENLAEIAERLGCDPASMLFLDDSPVERAEASAAMPGLQVWNGEIGELRSFLLTHPLLERPQATAEARSRPGLVRAQLRREEGRERAMPEEEFLRSLGIRLAVWRAAEAEAARVTELIQRTNQFNTTQERIPPDEVRTLVRDGEIYCLRAADRFADHGIVGALVLRRSDVRLLVLSCRVIGLRLAVPFVAAALRLSGNDRRNPRAQVVEQPRNQPARSVFGEAGFDADPDRPGWFELSRPEALAAIDETIHSVGGLDFGPLPQPLTPQ